MKGNEGDTRPSDRRSTRSSYGMVRVAALARDELVQLASAGAGGRLASATALSRLRTAVDIATDALDDVTADAPEYLRYALRMGGRATPFGLFAGVAPVEWAGERQLAIGAGTARVRVDARVAEVLVEAAELPLRPNPSLYAVDGVFRFQAAPGAEHSGMIEVAATPAVQLVVTAAMHGATIEDLERAMLDASHGLEPAAARQFIEQLIDTDLLVQETVLVRAGVEPHRLVGDLLASTSGSPQSAAFDRLADVSGVHDDLAQLPRLLSRTWSEAANAVDELSGFEVGRQFHIDLEFQGAELTLDRATVSRLERTLDVLTQHCAVPDSLAEFKKRFTARYQDAEAPLLEALDIDRGVCDQHTRRFSRLGKEAGIGSSLLGSAGGGAVPEIAIEALSAWTSSGETPDLSQLRLVSSSAAPVNAAHCVLAAPLGATSADYDAVFIEAGSHASQGHVGRFALPGTELHAHAENLARRESDSLPADHVFAEILTHLPGRVGNIELRPATTEESIDLFGSGGGTMRLSDLAVSVSENAVRLRHVPTNRWVVPVLTSSVNPDLPDAPHVFRWLARVASGGSAAWDWGPLDRLGHLPRVVHQRIIVSPERWRIDRSDIRAGLEHADPAAWLHRLPNIGDRCWFGIVRGDHVLPFNKDLVSTVTAAFEREQHGDGDVMIVELPHVEHPAVAGPGGMHVAEVAIPVPRHRSVRWPLDPPSSAPADSWLSYSLYCSTADADEVIRRASAVSRNLHDAGTIDQWFFIRYADPEDHVRLRLRPHAERDRRDAVAAIDHQIRGLVSNRLVSASTSGPYRPEVARYGGATGLPLCEAVFHSDSEHVVELLTPTVSDAERLYAVTASILQWSALLPEPLTFVKRAIAGYWNEFERSGKNKIGSLYNEHRVDLQSYLESTPAPADLLVTLKAVADAVVPQGDADDDQSDAYMPVFASLVHMHANRVFRTDQRRQELVAYEFARRVMVSQQHAANQKECR